MVLRRFVPKRKRTRVLALAGTVLIVVVAAAWASRPGPVADPPVQSAAQAQADAQRAAAAAAASADGSSTPASAAPQTTASAARVTQASTVPDVPLAWKRITEQAAGWLPATEAPQLGERVELATVPASRVRDTIGLNVDLWRTEAGYRDFAPVLAKTQELHLRHARVTMQPKGSYGLSRMQQLGRIGVRLNVLMGDALGRYGMTPYSKLSARFARSVSPYADSIEGTNEPDLGKLLDWPELAREHQAKVVATAAPTRNRPLGVIAPSVGRLTNLALLGDYTGLADAANAHAYSSAGEPSGALDQWMAGLKVQLQGGPVVVTEAGFQTDLKQTKYHTPLPETVEAAYTPRLILEAMRRGIPQVYLYEMIDRWADPFHIDTSAHFGLLHTNLAPKPAWTSLVRLQDALLDNGRPDAQAAPLSATVLAGPSDLRTLAFRRRDGTAALAVWRAVSQWDSQLLKETPVTTERVKLDVGAQAGGARVTDVVTGKRSTVDTGTRISLKLRGNPVIITGLRP